MKRLLSMFLMIVLSTCLAGVGSAEMGSENFLLNRSVISNGGGAMSSNSFHMIGTLSQASPLEKNPPAQGTVFGNFPGFWQALWNPLTCPKVSDLAARAKSGKVQLTWPHTGAEAYNVFRSNAADGVYIRIAEGVVTEYSTYLDLGLVDGTAFYYKVTSKCNGSQSGYSNTASATPQSRIRRR